MGGIRKFWVLGLVSAHLFLPPLFAVTNADLCTKETAKILQGPPTREPVPRLPPVRPAQPRRPNPPAAHNALRIDTVRTNDATLETISERDLRNLVSLGPFDPRRFSVMGGIGAGVNAENLASAAQGELRSFYSGTQYDRRGRVGGTFADGNPERPHYTAFADSVTRFPDVYVEVNGTQSASEWYHGKNIAGEYVPSSVNAELAAHSMAQGPSRPHLNVEVKRVITRSDVEAARAEVARVGERNVDEVALALANEPIGLWPHWAESRVRYQILDKNGEPAMLDGKVIPLQDEYHAVVTDVSGLGPPNNPFLPGTDSHTLTQEAFARDLKMSRGVIPAEPAGIHEGSFLFHAPDEFVREFARNQPVLMMGIGDSAMVALDKVMDVNGLPIGGPHVILNRSGENRIRPNVKRKIETANALVTVKAVTNFDVEQLANGRVAIHYWLKDRPTVLETLYAEKSKLKISPSVDARGETKTDEHGRILEWEIQIAGDRPRVKVFNNVDDKSVVLSKVPHDGNGPEKMHVEFDWKDESGTHHESFDMPVVVSAGFKNRNHDAGGIWGPNVKPLMRTVYGEIDHGHENSPGTVEMPIGKEVYALERTVTNPHTGISRKIVVPLRVPMPIAGPAASHLNPDFFPAQDSGPVTTAEQLREMKASNESVDAFAGNRQPVNAMGLYTADLVQDVRAKHPERIPRASELPAHDTGTVNVGKIVPRYVGEGSFEREAPPPHLTDLSPEAVGPKMLSDNLRAHATNLFIELHGEPNGERKQVRVAISLNDNKVSYLVEGLGSEGLKAFNDLVASPRGQGFRHSLDAYLRRFSGTTVVTLDFSAKGEFQRDSVRIGTPFAAMVEEFQRQVAEGVAPDKIKFSNLVSYLNRQVHPPDSYRMLMELTDPKDPAYPALMRDMTNWIKNQFIQLNGVEGHEKVEVVPGNFDPVRQKRYYMIKRNGVEDTILLEIPFKSGTEDTPMDPRVWGARWAVGQKLFEQAGLKDLLSVTVDRMAEGNVYARDSNEAFKNPLFLVFKVRSESGAVNLAGERAPKMDTDLIRKSANLLVTIHKRAVDSSSHAAANEGFASAVLEKLGRRDGLEREVSVFLGDSRWETVLAHGDFRREHVVLQPDRTLRVSGLGNTALRPHPILDVVTFVKDMEASGASVEQRKDFLREYMDGMGLEMSLGAKAFFESATGMQFLGRR